ncbi:MAG TPA: hypothetical protein PKD00_09585 [Burkholderiales bacterium]|nr:hypothetical protein [Burkholderiales bacterium]
MRIGQIKATAEKILNEIQAEEQEQIRMYKESELRQIDLDYFKTNDEMCRTIIRAKLFMDEEPTISHIILQPDPVNTYKNKYIYRHTNLDEHIEGLFIDAVENKRPRLYKPVDLAQVISALDYKSITSDNLLDIERQVKTSFRTTTTD